ncbi:MAG: BrnA antitoxin family protein [Prolixibacteraceae bacterium]|nr:BrnA antitoxin family protein [Burkholderiales bacterium]
MRKQNIDRSPGVRSVPRAAPRDRSNRSIVTTADSQRASNLELRGKTRLTMYLDTAVVEYFRSRAGGRGYQTLINEALKKAIEQESLEDVLRRVIREESRPYQVGKGKT